MDLSACASTRAYMSLTNEEFGIGSHARLRSGNVWMSPSAFNTASRKAGVLTDLPLKSLVSVNAVMPAIGGLFSKTSSIADKAIHSQL